MTHQEYVHDLITKHFGIQKMDPSLVPTYLLKLDSTPHGRITELTSNPLPQSQIIHDYITLKLLANDPLTSQDSHIQDLTISFLRHLSEISELPLTAQLIIEQNITPDEAISLAESLKS